ncbi:DEAD/DEAH box helicase [archaeon]|nr:MAG: DEAD/DEAH box helicase [archaeon]
MLVRDFVPANLLGIFPFDCFNAMQMQVVQQAYHTDQDMIVAAPTGSGKTVVLELALARLIMKHQGGQPFRCVYIAPSKALCQQRWTEWKIKLEPLRLQVLEVTGDVEWKEVLKIIASAAIIVTTPEKWDSLTRMWRDNVFLLGLIDLLLLDEIHHLGEERGAVLETVIVRMRVINKHCCNQMAADAQRK